MKIKSQDLETMEIEFAYLLEELGYTDHVDASPDVSLLDYGMLRNPDNNHCIFYQQRSGKHGLFEWTNIDVDDVKWQLKNYCEKPFFESHDMNLEDYLEDFGPRYLALPIDDINGYYGILYPSPLSDWDTTIDDIVEPDSDTVKLKENQSIVRPSKGVDDES